MHGGFVFFIEDLGVCSLKHTMVALVKKKKKTQFLSKGVLRFLCPCENKSNKPLPGGKSNDTLR